MVSGADFSEETKGVDETCQEEEERKTGSASDNKAKDGQLQQAGSGVVAWCRGFEVGVEFREGMRGDDEESRDAAESLEQLTLHLVL